MSQVSAYPIKPKEHEQPDWHEVSVDRTRHLRLPLIMANGMRASPFPVPIGMA